MVDTPACGWFLELVLRNRAHLGAKAILSTMIQKDLIEIQKGNHQMKNNSDSSECQIRRICVGRETIRPESPAASLLQGLIPMVLGAIKPASTLLLQGYRQCYCS